MNNKRKKIYKKNYNSHPPFSWLLIFFVVIIFEIVVLSQERAWSQNYQLSIDNFRDQANVLSSLNMRYYSYISNFYEYSLNLKDFNNNTSTITNNIFLKEAERYVLKQKPMEVSLR